MEKFEKRKEIASIFLSGSKSSTLIIPKSTAAKYDLDTPGRVVLEELPDGIMIRKLEI